MQQRMIVDTSAFSLPRTRNNRLFVCLDGFKHTSKDCNTLARLLCSQLNQEDRIVICTGTSSIGESNKEVLKSNSLWSQDEYLAAITNQEFYEKIASKLDTTSSLDLNESDSDDELDEDEKKKHAVQLKFYYAGGSCRFLFQYTTNEVKRMLEKGRNPLMDLVKHCDGTTHNGMIDHFYGMQSDRHKRFPVTTSLFAADCVAEVIQELMKRIK
ncbi:hypothetical protein L915_16255 [Phytophthora nicotianae]|uniref:Uncharacterized protein n=1 Tax=Phytophthora nicotianae TaxID=4792 RepID=W2IC32_PHYNI|nr:hypothetical protein L915_16255 [Phytophthora nicotianae]ETL30923.1 hypothetical protein L916_16148 [Phytophthora nicotianae]